MPVVLDRLPLPNLTWYTGFSFVLLVCSVYYAGVQVTQHSNWKDKYIDREKNYHAWPDNQTKNSTYFIQKSNAVNRNETMMPSEVFGPIRPTSARDLNIPQCDSDYKTTVAKKSEFRHADYENVSGNCSNLSFDEIIEKVKISKMSKYGLKDVYKSNFTPYIIPDIISFMFHEPLCIWTLINMAYCILILLGTAIQRVVFGELRVSEQQHIKDKFWNFVFYKFIFVFGVMNVQAMDGVVLWCSWFSVLGFLHLLAQLCEDRFEYLSFSLTTPKRTHMRLFALLGLILLLATSCLLITVVVGFHAGLNTFAFMAAECILLMVRTLYVLTRYCIYLWDITHEGLWEKRGRYIYYTELAFELSELSIDMAHHIHMVIWANMLLTMATLVICMQVRLLFYQLQHKIKSHRNYMRVVKHIKRYPEIDSRSLNQSEETCAICWEGVGIGRLLDCKHIFHSSCLLSWLHHDMSCPTCRHKLVMDDGKGISQPGLFSGLIPMGVEGTLSSEASSDQQGNGARNAPSPGSPDGSSQSWRYVSWLSSFSVEQSHTQLPRHHQPNAQTVAATSQLDSLARQVQQMFTDISYSSIYEDLRQTRSIEATIDNILENKLLAPPPMFSNDEEGSDSSSEGFAACIAKKDNGECKLFKRDGQIPFSSEDDPSEDSWSLLEEDQMSKESSTCGRFSKSSQEREAILAERKENLLSLARLRFNQRNSIKKNSIKKRPNSIQKNNYIDTDPENKNSTLRDVHSRNVKLAGSCHIDTAEKHSKLIEDEPPMGIGEAEVVENAEDFTKIGNDAIENVEVGENLTVIIELKEKKSLN